MRSDWQFTVADALVGPEQPGNEARGAEMSAELRDWRGLFADGWAWHRFLLTQSVPVLWALVAQRLSCCVQFVPS